MGILKNFLIPPRVSELNISELNEYIPPISKGRVIKVYDGDSITVACKLNALSKIYKFSIRLNGIDTPEIRTSNEIEKEYALKIRDILKEKIYDKIVKIKVKGKDKYGRYLCDVIYNAENINVWLLDKKYAVKYNGGKKSEFDEQYYKSAFENTS